VLPAHFVDGVKDVIMRRFYVPGYVSRTDPLVFAFQRYVRHKPPRLHRLLFHVTDHCNLNCKGCTHFSNISPQRFADLDAYRADMTRLTEVFSGITEIFLLGGEPLLHPEIASFITTTRELFPESRINVMTNGVKVPHMPDEFWEAMRTAGAWLLCDDYPAGPTRAEIDALTRTQGVEIEWTDPREEFFKLPIDIEGKQDAKASFRSCRGVMNCPILRDGRLYPCAYTAFIDIFTDRYGVEGVDAGERDSISVADKPYSIMDFLMQPVPWCRHCDFEHKASYEWGRSDRAIDEWVVGECEDTTGPVTRV
jgi:MoaA/NifB/PqqE/SkfB family radical SAM enzyme